MPATTPVTLDFKKFFIMSEMVLRQLMVTCQNSISDSGSTSNSVTPIHRLYTPRLSRIDMDDFAPCGVEAPPDYLASYHTSL
jgi:hypothetical protein